MNLHRSGFIRFASLRTGKNYIHEQSGPLIIQAEIRHILDRTPDRHQNFPGLFPDSGIIKAHRKPVPATAANMTAATGKSIKHPLPLFQKLRLAKGISDIFTGPQSGMSDVITVRRRIAVMAVTAAAAPGIMSRMARQTELKRLRYGYRSSGKKQGKSQKAKDQFAPLKNSATTVSSTMTALNMMVSAETARCSRGNQQAR